MFQLSRCLHEIDFIFYLFCYNRFYSRICYLLLNLSPQEKTSNSFYRRAAKKTKSAGQDEVFKLHSFGIKKPLGKAVWDKGH